MIKVFPVRHVVQIDKYTIDNEPIASIDLMERAARQIFKWLIHHFSKRKVLVLIGPGNNGGDGLVLARLLYKAGWEVRVCLLTVPERLSEDGRANFERLPTEVSVDILANGSEMPVIESSYLIIDALFGSGLNRSLTDLASLLVQHMNQSEATVLSVDIPSGLMGEDNRSNNMDAVINADYTLTFQFPKLAFLLPDGGEKVGQLEILDIGLHPRAIVDMDTSWFFINRDAIKQRLKKRCKFSHKGHFGHALLLAGSYGKMGAAVLASRGCLKAGVGLLTVHVPHFGYQVIQTAVPEAMVSIDRSDILISEFPDLKQFNAIGVGPGIGCKPNTCKALDALFDNLGEQQLVIDADALNSVSQNKNLLAKLPANSILTPHPKEFDRLAGVSSNGYERFERAVAFARKHQVILVLKGAHTLIALPDGRCCFNSTGNPGMATAGSGDVLTGILLGLLAQGYLPEEAAIVGVYLHGLAGDLAALNEAHEGVTATSLIENLGAAFLELHSW
jgi:NAD(P)H-hydrate epimerase